MNRVPNRQKLTVYQYLWTKYNMPEYNVRF